MTHAGDAHLVYVRRKPESAKLASVSNPCDTHDPNPAVDCLKLGKARNLDDESSRAGIDLKESTVPIVQASPISMPPPSLGFSSAKPSNSVSPANLIHLNGNHIPTKVNAKVWEVRQCQLDNLLKQVDQSDQKVYIEMLRTLSSVELSKNAVDLEKRSIQLSLEEAKELQRVQALNVLERYSNHSRAPSTNQGLSEK